MEYLHQLQQPSGALIWFDLPGVADYEDAIRVIGDGREVGDCVCNVQHS